MGDPDPCDRTRAGQHPVTGIPLTSNERTLVDDLSEGHRASAEPEFVNHITPIMVRHAQELFQRGYLAGLHAERARGAAETSGDVDSIREISRVNLQRCLRWHPEGIESWSLSDWAVALAGEVGELCDAVKKLNRVRDGLTGNKVDESALWAALPKEAADVYLYLDLFARRAKFDLATAIYLKFNEVSERNGFPERLGSPVKAEATRSGPGPLPVQHPAPCWCPYCGEPHSPEVSESDPRLSEKTSVPTGENNG